MVRRMDRRARTSSTSTNFEHEHEHDTIDDRAPPNLTRAKRECRGPFRLDSDAAPQPTSAGAPAEVALSRRSIELDQVEVVARFGHRAVDGGERHRADVFAQEHGLDEGHAEGEELLRIKERRVPAALEVHPPPQGPR